MTNASYSRFLWKEYRTLRGFWLCVLGFALGTQLFLFWVIEKPRDAEYSLFYTASVLAACYALGCGAVLFASEREDGTYELIRRLPIAPWRTIAGKLSFAVISTLLLLLVLHLSAWVLANKGPTESWGDVIGRRDGLIFLFLLECLAWGLFFSLITGRVLASLLLAVVALLTVSYATEPAKFMLFNAFRLTALLFVLLVDGWLAHRWMLGRQLEWSWWGRDTRRQHRLAAWVAAWETTPPWRRYVKRMLWLQWRQARRFVLVYLTAALVLIVVSVFTSRYLYMNLSGLLIPATPFLLGLWSFRGEQQGRRFRFLTERGVAPASVWLSKQLVWFALALAATIVAIGVAALSEALSVRSSADIALTERIVGEIRQFADGLARGLNRSFQLGIELMRSAWPMLSAFLVSSYALGQGVSLLIPRAVTAGFVGAILLVPLVAWHLLIFWLDVPTWLALLPIPFVLWGVTLVRVSDWMVERNSVGAWARVAAMILLPAAVVVAGIARYRVAEIPGIVPLTLRSGRAAHVRQRPVEEVLQPLRSAVLRPLTPEERETARIYRRAMDLVGISFRQPVTYRKVPPADRQEALRLVWEATQREHCVLRDPSIARYDDVDRSRHRGRLSSLAFDAAWKSERLGKLEEALDKWIEKLRMSRHFATRSRSYGWDIAYTSSQSIYRRLAYWAARSNQKVETIVKAIHLLGEEHAKFPPITESIMVESVVQRSAIGEPRPVDTDRAVWSHEMTRAAISRLFATLCPWELTRAECLLDVITANQILEMHSLDDALADGDDLAAQITWGQPSGIRRIDSQTFKRLKNTTPLFPENAMSINLVSSPADMVFHEMRYRGCLVRLALHAYRLEHGSLPEHLEELVPKYFDRLPLDPWSGRAFGYRPEGFPTEVTMFSIRISPKEPLIWSVGPENGRAEVYRPITDPQQAATYGAMRSSYPFLIFPADRSRRSTTNTGS
jgi:ABC-type transport system involved in multi-copper enzyme maturation permease subunit